MGRAFYDHARRVIETLDEAEALVSSFSGKPQGVIRLTAPWAWDDGWSRR